MFNFTENKKGNVLLLALLIMSGMIMAGLGLGTLIVNEIRQARNIDNSVIAFYMADLGVEESLYNIRKTEKTFSEIKTELEPEKIVGTGEVVRDLENIEPNIFKSLEENEVLYVDLYDPDQVSLDAGVDEVVISWQDADDCAPGSASVEFSYIQWDPSSITLGGWSDIDYQFIYPDPATITSFSTNKSYQVRIKALNCGVKDLEVEAHDENGDVVGIPNRIVIDSIGSFAKTKQALKVTIPRRSPLSGLYDYILFSEQSLLKEIY